MKRWTFILARISTMVPGPRWGLLVACIVACWTSQAAAQAPEDDEGPVVRDSGVGYIDSAVPATQFRFRYDSAYHSNRPTRGEYFYPKGGATGPGLPVPDSRIDYQDFTAYVELAYRGRLSVFLEAPYRLLNPTINANADGFGDLKTGFKWAFWESDRSLLTAQFKVYLPTGDSERGLGTHHPSFEPGLLFQNRLAPGLLLEGEARYWIPSAGTDFQGDAFQYGLGLTWGQRNPHGFWANPVTEFVGWTFLGGKELILNDGTTAIVSARGDTIVNGKAGLRFGWGERLDM